MGSSNPSLLVRNIAIHKLELLDIKIVSVFGEALATLREYKESKMINDCNKILLTFCIVLFVAVCVLYWERMINITVIEKYKKNRALDEEFRFLAQEKILLLERQILLSNQAINHLEKSLKKSERIKLGENKSGNLLLELYDERNTKDVFLFKDGLIR